MSELMIPDPDGEADNQWNEGVRYNIGKMKVKLECLQTLTPLG